MQNRGSHAGAAMTLRVFFRFVFGFRADVTNNLAYAEDGAVVYPAGHNIVLYSPDIRTQRLIPGTMESEGISAMCVSSNKKLLAVAERSDKAIITVYDLQTLKRRKVLVAPDVGSKVRSCMSAGHTNTHMYAHTCTHTHVHTHTHTPHAHTHVHTHTETHTRTHICTSVHTKHTCTYTHAHKLT